MTIPEGDEDGGGSSSGLTRAITNFHQKGISSNFISAHGYLQSRDINGQKQNSSFGARTLEFSNDGSWFISGGIDGRVLLWPTKKALDTRWTPDPTVMDDKHKMYSTACLAISPDNGKIVSGGLDKKMIIHDTTTY